MILAVRNRCIRAGIALVVVPTLACTSSTEMEKVQAQLQEIQLELLELRKQSPSKADVDGMESALTRELSELVTSQGQVRLELETLAEEIGKLEAKLDDTDFHLAQLAQQIEAASQELQAVRNAAETPRVVPVAPPQTAPNPTDPQALYDTAYNDYVRGSYDLAILGFRQYLESHRDTELADNAVYWIGECYFRQRKFQKAIEQFDEVLTRHQSSDRNPSAVLKKGYAYLELGQRPQGVVQLQNVICEYSGTDEAHLARQRLQALGIDVDCEEP